MKYLHFMLALVFSLPAFAASVTIQFAVKRQISFSATTSNQVALTANPNRNYLLIQNNGTDMVFIKVGSAITASEGIQIPSGGGSVEFAVSPMDEIDVKANSGTQALVIIEGNAS